MSVLDVLTTLVRRLEDPKLIELGVIPWAAPVVSFGDISQSKIATLGLNPSNREYVDVAGIELDGHDRRFHTLSSLGLSRWGDITTSQLHQILDSCNGYFTGNPYDGWFGALDKLIMGTHVSYYGLFSKACHLDLVPYATAAKWMDLTSTQKFGLLNSAGDGLGLLLRESSVEVLILNGQSVIENLQLIGECTFNKTAVSDWTLPRRQSPGVTGYAYKGAVSRISGVDLGREISILGYSHNIQSSFGVTTQVKNAIQQWITVSAGEVVC